MMAAYSGKSRKLIVIVGFMGSGKTTVARELGSLLKCPAIDLDELICERKGLSPRDIIDRSGEVEFRRIETETLRNVLAEQSGDEKTRIIALGGGAWTIKTTRDLITRHEGLTIWLDASFESCWRRIEGSASIRPLAPTQEKARNLYNVRRSLYALGTIHLAIPESETAADTASRIETALK